MTILSQSQRDFIRVDTMISPIIIDRVADAFDHLLRQDMAGYVEHMGTAVVMLGPEPPRPTAVDVVKTIVIRAYADQKRISYRRAHRELTALIEEGKRGL